VKLAYRDVPAPERPGQPGAAMPAVVLHREGETSFARPLDLVRATREVGRVLVPFGNYASYPSGMEVGGICWYRLLPGYAGTDPISLATAVVQVCDLLDDQELSGALLVGFGQGAVVALGAGLLRAGRVRALVCADLHGAHLDLLPAAVWEAGDPPPVLLTRAGAPTDSDGASMVLEREQEALATRGVAASTWSWVGEAADRDATERALSDGIAGWIRALPRLDLEEVP
jgi:pimeloyl-ACP methyl ester carboxylesterase